VRCGLLGAAGAWGQCAPAAGGAAEGVRRERRRFPVGASPTRQVLQPEATGATVEVTKRLKPSGNACHELR
jgi:hypothetical protein